MDTEFKTLVREYIQKKHAADLLEKDLKRLRAQIIEHHGDKDVVNKDGIESKLVHAVRSDLMKESVATFLGHDIPDEWFKKTPYIKLQVKILD